MHIQFLNLFCILIGYCFLAGLFLAVAARDPNSVTVGLLPGAVSFFVAGVLGLASILARWLPKDRMASSSTVLGVMFGIILSSVFAYGARDAGHTSGAAVMGSVVIAGFSIVGALRSWISAQSG